MNDLFDATLYGREGKPFLPDAQLLDACRAARILGTPLLLTGEPGCGKTDFAFAVARRLAQAQAGIAPLAWDAADEQHGLLDCYIRSDTQARDLLYRYDAVRHFGDAHQRDTVQGAKHYIELLPLGRALCEARQRVVLIDEIDKAPRDLPNDLLRELDQGRFHIAEIPLEDREAAVQSHGFELRHDMGLRRGPQDPRPLVIITSNEERQLPDPFLRRCVFFHIPFPDRGQLVEILKGWFPDLDPPVLDRGVQVFEALRQKPGLNKKPATSELIGWLRVLAAHQQLDRLRSLAQQSVGSQDWKTLPFVGCLLKLRADWQLVGLQA